MRPERIRSSERSIPRTRLLFTALTALLVVVPVLGSATAAQAAPPAAPTFTYTLSKLAGTTTYDLGAGLEPGSTVTAVVPVGANSSKVGATVEAPTSITVTPTGSATYPNYSFAATLQYTVENNGESATGQVDLTIVQKPWMTASPATATVKPGQSATLKVTARGWGFTNGAEDGGTYAIKDAGPAVGTATVASDGTVTYSAPAGAAYGTYAFNVVATDGLGQESELYTPLSVTVASAEADRFQAYLPYESAVPGTRVEILPDHARGVNPRVTNVTANIANAAVAFDTTGVTFTPPANYNWGPDQTSYVFAAPYTVTDDNGSTSGQIDVTVLRRPLLSVSIPTPDAPIGGAVTATVKASNFPVIPATGGYSIAIPPTAGSATVSDTGVVTFDATGTKVGETYTVRVRVTDIVQQSETIDVVFTAIAAPIERADPAAPAAHTVSELAKTGSDATESGALVVMALLLLAVGAGLTLRPSSRTR